MEASDRPARDRLTLLRAIAAEPHEYGFFHAVRLVECLHRELPRIGSSRRLRDDPVRLAQEPSLGFALATLTALELPEDGKPRLRSQFAGLTGPNGPLPLHLTEFARDRLRNHGDRTIVRFLDIFHHRFFSMFYRAWADAQPTVSLDRPGQDPFGERLGALAGYAGAALQDRDAVPDFARRAHTGLLAHHVRSAEGLSRIIGNFFQVVARIEQWRPHWMKLPPEATTCIGAGQANAQLGVTSVIGSRVWDCQSRFRIVIGPLDLARYKRFLPGELSLARLRDWVRSYTGFELSCELQLKLARSEVPPLALGRSGQLGWTSWLGSPPADVESVDDLVLLVL